MTGLQCADAQSRPTEFLDFTSLTLEEFQILIPPFECRVPGAYGGVALRWDTPDGPPIYCLQALPFATPEESPVSSS